MSEHRGGLDLLADPVAQELLHRLENAPLGREPELEATPEPEPPLPEMTR